jgi:hypothetical protein
MILKKLSKINNSINENLERALEIQKKNNEIHKILNW